VENGTRDWKVDGGGRGCGNLDRMRIKGEEEEKKAKKRAEDQTKSQAENQSTYHSRQFAKNREKVQRKKRAALKQ